MLFLSVLHLAAGTNREGSLFALERSWRLCGFSAKQTPDKSALSRYRENVKSDFFQDIFQADLTQHSSSRKTFRGFYIYAIDGDHLDLPCSEGVLGEGYRGASISKREETHYPKMYTAQAVDMVNETVCHFEYSSKKSEVLLARQIVPSLERNSITLYDRYYDSYETAAAHQINSSYFFVRLRKCGLRGQADIKKFAFSKKRSAWIMLPPAVRETLPKRPPIRVRLIKVKNTSTGEDMMFMTNVPEGIISNKDAAIFYLRRWGIESSFKDLTDTLKMCQWHSAKINGILQEIYALLWLANNVRRMTNAIVKKTGRWLERKYRKSNFKFIASLLMDNLDLLIKGKNRKLRQDLAYWAEKSAENREHLSRSYPRQVKRHGKKYKNASCVPRRAAR
jgi:hypothetical protein